MKTRQIIVALMAVIGLSVGNAWGAGIYIDYGGNKYYNGSTITINMDYYGSELYDETEMAIKNDAGWTDAMYYGYGYIKASISGAPVPDNLYFNNEFGVKSSSSQAAYLDDEDNPVSFYEYNSEDAYEYIYFGVIYDFTAAGTYTATLTIWQEELQDPKPTYQSATITIQYVVTASCSSNPTVTEGSNSSVRSTTATVSCSSGISSLGSAGCNISDYGFVIGSSANPAIGDDGVTKHQVSTTYTSTGVGFSKNLTDLTPNTTYYVRPYATNGNGTAYGTQTSFTTLQRYTITYYCNYGGTPTASKTEYKDHGIDYTISSDKWSRDYYTLSKWHTNSSGIGGTDYNKGETYTGNAALNLYAVWVVNKYTVSFNSNGGSGSMEAVQKNYGAKYSLPANGFAAPEGKVFKCWAQGSAGGTERAVGYSHTVSGDITFYAIWRDGNYTDAKFSCAEWSVTGPTEDTVFITSTASKTVRSQQAFHVTASGLPASTELTFTTFPANTRFTFKKADGTAISTDTYGKVNTDFYVYYTPTSGDTSDGLDVFSTLYVSVTGEPRKDTLNTKTVIGRHLPADFVIAAKYNGKWYALPANMTGTTNPGPKEIAVDDSDNPTIAYTENTNFFQLYGQGYLEKIKFGMPNNSTYPNYPLFGSATGTSTIGRGGSATSVTSELGNQYLWTLQQTNTSISDNPQDAKYTIYCANNTQSLELKNSPNQWGLYSKTSKDVDELRLIPASAAKVVEAYAVEWGQHGMVVEVDAQGISATKVKAKLSGSETGLITLSETKTSVKNRDTKYNYTVDFGVGFDLAASTALGKILMLEWYNSSDVMVGVTSIELPKIIATSATMSSIETKKTEWAKWEVHILPDVTLTANLGSFSSGGAIRELHVYPGATLKVTTAGTAQTITIDTLILRNGWTRVGTKKFDVARVYLQPYISDSYKATTLNHTKAYLDWYIDYDQYYPMAVPWPVTVSGIKYKNSKIAASNITYYHYDGARRAANVQESQDDNWAQITPTTLEPSKGYAILAKRPNGKAFGIVRMPLTFDNTWTTSGEQGEVSGTHKDQVTVTAYGKGTTPWYAMGWNFIANPYMASFNGDADGITGSIETQSGTSYKYATIPTVDFTNYDQYPIAESTLKPCSPFFVQGTNAEGEVVTFSQGKIITAAPQFRATPQPMLEQTAYIRLNYEGGKDQMGLIIGEDYTANYEPDADLVKMLGSANAVKTYMRYNGDMAYVAINQTLAQEWIPVTVNIPAAGEYTYSLTNSSVVGQLEGVYLIDYATDIITNLIEQNYIFNTTTAGTITNRFAINAIVGERQTPTPIDAVEQDHKNTNEPIKFIYRDKMYIMFNGVIYDATGKKVR